MHRIIKVIELLQTTNKSPEEISFLAGNITPYAVKRIRIMLGWKKYCNKPVSKMTKGNLKEFYSVLETENQTFKKLRKVFELLLTTNYSNERISDMTEEKISFIQTFRKIADKNECNWQVMKCLSNPGLLDYIHKDNPLHIPYRTYKSPLFNISLGNE